MSLNAMFVSKIFVNQVSNSKKYFYNYFWTLLSSHDPQGEPLLAQITGGDIFFYIKNNMSQ